MNEYSAIFFAGTHPRRASGQGETLGMRSSPRLGSRHGTPARWFAASALVAIALAMPQRAQAQGSDLAPCSDWLLQQNGDSLNALGPDAQATYWWVSYTNLPGTRLRIEGSYPEARFFSFAVQDESLMTLGSLRDSNILPDAGATNPFREPAADGQPRTYTLFIDPNAAPPEPAPNTFYAGKTLEGLPNPGGTVIYRVYVPTDQADPAGSVGLPKVSLETPAGNLPLSLTQCTPLPGNTGGPGNAVLTEMDHPTAVPALKPSNSAYTDPPDFKRVYGGQFTDPVVYSLPPDLSSQVPRRPGLPVQNADFPYLMSQTHRYFGETIAVRFKAPSFPDTVVGESVLSPHQVRYWSLCSYSAVEEGGMRLNRCASDFLTHTDPDGWVNVVVSDPAHRPDAVIDPAKGVHWLPWGSSSAAAVFMRLGVPDEQWPNNPLRVDPQAADQVAAAREVMQDYYPVARYCPTSQILEAGIDSCFETAPRAAGNGDDDDDRNGSGGQRSGGGSMGWSWLWLISVALIRRAAPAWRRVTRSV